MPSRRRIRVLLIALTGTIVVLALGAVLVERGVVWPNRLFAARYDVRGVDVSAWQGTGTSPGTSPGRPCGSGR